MLTLFYTLGHPRIAVRADIEEYKASNKVTVISGGGSGHEPLAAGRNYSGAGMNAHCILGLLSDSGCSNGDASCW